MGLKHDDGWNIPAANPFYPLLPAIYRNVRFQFFFFYAVPAAVQGFLPEPLEATEDGLCVASGLEVPFCTNYGPFQESFIVMRCRFRGQIGFYCSHVFHNGPAGIAAGREIYGTPKVYAALKVTASGSVHGDGNLGQWCAGAEYQFQCGNCCAPRCNALLGPRLAVEDYSQSERSGTCPQTIN